MADQQSRTVTHLLLDWGSGREEARDDLVPMVYDELRRIARQRLARERSDHTLQPTELVHEAYARLVDAEVSWRDRAHFFAVASRLMRRILVDHARARGREKRGGEALHVTLDEELVSAGGASGILELDEALERLSRVDERKCRVVELRFFGGLTYDEIAAALDVSAATVDRDLRMATAWIRRELS